ncbi:MAG: hypothetical protein DMG63_07215 [Acidobacteria bacterium]|nr:MAG: hypothetical protein DMG63_07215 [Acidobacteriota bacterium]
MSWLPTSSDTRGVRCNLTRLLAAKSAATLFTTAPRFSGRDHGSEARANSNAKIQLAQACRPVGSKNHRARYEL